MKKPVFYYSAGVLSVAILLAILWGFGFLLESAFDMGGGDEERVVSSLSSPDGEYVATTYVAMGGGAAGWCYKRVSINKKSEPFSLEKERERGGYSFDVSCGSELEVKWESNRELLVSYTGSENEAGISIYQRPVSQDRAVRIKYLPK